MKDYIKASRDIEQFIENVTCDTIPTACNMLNDFWQRYCEVNVKFLFFLNWTKHNHAAKGAWADLDYKLRQQIKRLSYRC